MDFALVVQIEKSVDIAIGYTVFLVFDCEKYHQNLVLLIFQFDLSANKFRDFVKPMFCLFLNILPYYQFLNNFLKFVGYCQ